MPLVSLIVTLFREKRLISTRWTRSKNLERSLMWTVELHFYLLTYQDWLRVQYIFSNFLTFCLKNQYEVYKSLLGIKVDPNLIFRHVCPKIVCLVAIILGRNEAFISFGKIKICNTNWNSILFRKLFCGKKCTYSNKFDYCQKVQNGKTFPFISSVLYTYKKPFIYRENTMKKVISFSLCR